MTKLRSLLLLCFLYSTIGVGQNVIQEIIDEATKTITPTSDYPLPLASTYLAGTLPVVHPYPHNFGKSFFTLKEQVDLIRKGHHFLPNIANRNYAIPPESTILGDGTVSQTGAPTSLPTDSYCGYYDGLQFFKQNGLPITVTATGYGYDQWENILVRDPSLVASYHPNNEVFVTEQYIENGEPKVRKILSPMADTGTWETAGKKWADSTNLKSIMNLYPNPPLVILLSNNEAVKIKWHQDNLSPKFSNLGISGDMAIRKKFTEKWKERYTELQTGIKSSLNQNWKDSIKFVGYLVNDLGWAFRFNHWDKYSEYHDNKLMNAHQYWDGGSSSYYIDNVDELSDYWVQSQQVEYMNNQMILEDTRQDKPNFWHELATWDGAKWKWDYSVTPSTTTPDGKRKWFAEKGQTYNSNRYKGYVQFGMWLTRPRVVREFRSWVDDRELVGKDYYDKILDAVDVVHEDAVLKKFWRKGSLVKNFKYIHPYQKNVPAEFAQRERWCLLDTNRDPERDPESRIWKLNDTLPVYSIARVKGVAPHREWLVYGFAPKGDEKKVTITIPSRHLVNGATIDTSFPITVDIKQKGSFYHIKENCLNGYTGTLLVNVNVAGGATDTKSAKTMIAQNSIEPNGTAHYTGRDIKLTSEFWGKSQSDVTIKAAKCITEVGDVVSSKNSYVIPGYTEATNCNASSTPTTSLSIDENESRNGLKVYPNPTNNVLNIDYPFVAGQQYHIKLFNSLGQLLLSKRITNSDKTINVTNINEGLYILKMYVQSQEIETKKIIIKN